MSRLLPPTLNSFSVLAGTAVIANSELVAVIGNVGVYPGTTVSGFPPARVVNGTIHNNDTTAQEAHDQLRSTINTLRMRPITRTLPTTLDSEFTITPGVYDFTGNDVTITGFINLASLDPNPIFIFLINGSLEFGQESGIIASSYCNVYWVVGTTITSRSLFPGSFGNLLARGNISTLGNDLASALLSLDAVILNSSILGKSCNGGTGGGGGTGVRRLLCDPIDDCICHKRRTKKCTKCHRTHICKFCGCDPRNKYDGNNDCVNNHVVTTVNTNNGNGNCRTCGQR